LKLDNQFNIIEVISYLNSIHVTYQFSPTNEYEYIVRIERNNRAAQDKLSCALAISANPSKNLWLFALSDVIAKLNNIPRKHLSWYRHSTPYFQWFGINYDFINTPLIPFGCRVMAHTPVQLQTKLGDNSILHYYVGPAPYHKQGVLLYNPKTKSTIVRRSFHQLNHDDQPNPTLPIVAIPTPPHRPIKFPTPLSVPQECNSESLLPSPPSTPSHHHLDSPQLQLQCKDLDERWPSAAPPLPVSVASKPHLVDAPSHSSSTTN